MRSPIRTVSVAGELEARVDKANELACHFRHGAAHAFSPLPIKSDTKY